MKIKIIGILVCFMLMTAFLTTAQYVENSPIREASNEIEPISSYDVEAPIWELGDKWSYKLDRFIIDFMDADISFYMNIKMDNYPMEVTKVTEDFYELTFESSSNGTFWLNFDLGDGPINISFNFESTTIEGSVIINKTSMGIKEVHLRIYGIFDVEFVDQPYVNEFLFKLHKKVDVTIDLDIIFENPNQPIVKFPFNIGDCWGFPANNFTLFSTIESQLFYDIDNLNKKINPILHFLDDFFGWPWIKRLVEFSDILLDILPIIDICHILTDYIGEDCIFSTQEVEIPIICCLGKDWVTVPAGTFECYNISIIGTDIGNIYYNSTLGAIIKIIGNFEDVLSSVNNIDAELISYYV